MKVNKQEILESTLEKHLPRIASFPIHDWVQEATEEYGRQMWNKAIEKASEEAETTFDSAHNVVVDRESILKLKL